MSAVGILRSRRLLVVALWMVPLMHVVMITWGRTIHLCWVSVVCRTSYFSSFLVVVAWGNLSVQYVNPRNCTLRLGGVYMGVCLWVLCLGCIVCPGIVWRGT